jgi:hypothetical protein
MSRKLLAAAPALIATLGFMTAGALADAPGHKPGRHSSSANHHRGYAHRQYPPEYRPAPAYGAAPGYWDMSGRAHGAGYVFVPGRGILGEACNLPTSACSNQYRDTQ